MIFIIETYIATNVESTVKIGPEISEKSGGFCPVFCPVFVKIPQTPFLNSEVTEPIYATFSNDVEAFVPRLMHALTEQ